MEEDDEDSIKKKRLLQKQKIIEAKKAEEQLRAALRSILEPGAYDRLSNVRIANQELYIAATQYALATYKRIGNKITEQQLLNILYAIKSQKDEQTSIRFERK